MQNDKANNQTNSNNSDIADWLASFMPDSPEISPNNEKSIIIRKSQKKKQRRSSCYDGIDIYRYNIYNCELNSPQERHTLFRLYNESYDIQIREKLIIGNLRYVLKFAQQFSFYFPEVDEQDLISEGSIGLMKAIDKYNINSNASFGTYAAYWIKQYIKRYIMSQRRVVRLPSRVEEILWEIKKYIKANYIISSYSEIPIEDYQIISDAIGISVEYLYIILHNYLIEKYDIDTSFVEDGEIISQDLSRYKIQDKIYSIVFNSGLPISVKDISIELHEAFPKYNFSDMLIRNCLTNNSYRALHTPGYETLYYIPKCTDPIEPILRRKGNAKNPHDKKSSELSVDYQDFEDKLLIELLSSPVNDILDESSNQDLNTNSTTFNNTSRSNLQDKEIENKKDMDDEDMDDEDMDDEDMDDEDMDDEDMDEEAIDEEDRVNYKHKIQSTSHSDIKQDHIDDINKTMKDLLDFFT